jgi:hypothetical protein
MQNVQSKKRSMHPLSYVVIVVFLYLGFFSDLIYLSATFLILGAEIARRSVALGSAVAAFGVALFLALIGLQLGRDSALRDNARDNAPLTAEH